MHAAVYGRGWSIVRNGVCVYDAFDMEEGPRRTHRAYGGQALRNEQSRAGAVLETSLAAHDDWARMLRASQRGLSCRMESTPRTPSMLWRSCGGRAQLIRGRSWWTSTQSRRRSCLLLSMRMTTLPELMRSPLRWVLGSRVQHAVAHAAGMIRRRAPRVRNRKALCMSTNVRGCGSSSLKGL